MKNFFKLAEGGQGPDLGQLGNQVAAALQQGQDPLEIAMSLLQQMAPEQVAQILMQAGLPQEQVVSIIQNVVQQQQDPQQTQDPQQPQGPSPEEIANDPQVMMAFGGEFKSELNKSLSDKLALPASTSENYTNELFKVFSEKVKRNLAQHLVSGKDTEGPTQFMAGGGEPKTYTQDEFDKALQEKLNSYLGGNMMQYYNRSNTSIPLYGYQDPRTMIPQAPPFARLVDQFLGPKSIVPTGVTRNNVPNDLNIQDVLSGQNKDYTLGDIEHFTNRKGLFRKEKGIRFNLNPVSKQPMVNQPQEYEPNGWHTPMIADPNEGEYSVKKVWPEVKASSGIDMSFEEKINFNPSDVADFGKNSMDQTAYFLERLRDYQSKKNNEASFFSSANETPNSMESMSRGLYDQQGNFIPDEVGNEVLNPTKAFGDYAKNYMMAAGGNVEFTPEEIALLKKAGYTLK